MNMAVLLCCAGDVLRQGRQVRDAVLHWSWDKAVPSWLWKVVTAFQQVACGLFLVTEGR